MIYDVIIVGGGASGFFASNALLDNNPALKLLMLEKTDKLLQKVKISGGGRCNVTHHDYNPTSFSKSYPRGSKLLKKNLRTFGAEQMIEWLTSKGVATKVEGDGRMFPITNSSQTIIDCYLEVLDHQNFTLIKKCGLVDFQSHDDHLSVKTNQGSWHARHLILAGGSSKALWSLLEQKGIEVIPPTPSLFTFTLKDHPLQGLEGISIPNALLITHKGISGPAVLRLSAFGARELAEVNYVFEILINFTGLEKEEEVRSALDGLKVSKKRMLNSIHFGLSKRLWERILERANIPSDKPGLELSKKDLNKLITELYQGSYLVQGKNTFKEEFVTAGGVALSEIEKSTYEFKKLPKVYAIGELLDIDGVTGGFNFQGCWTGGWMVASYISRHI